MSAIILYVDGGADPNPGIGGWAAYLTTADGKYSKLIGGGAVYVTNNVMEITAAIEGLRALKQPSQVTVYTDSQYLIGVASKGWRRRQNKDLLLELDTMTARHTIDWQHVPGHSGNEGNERCHQRVQDEIAKMRVRTTVLDLDAL